MEVQYRNQTIDGRNFCINPNYGIIHHGYMAGYIHNMSWKRFVKCYIVIGIIVNITQPTRGWVSRLCKATFDISLTNKNSRHTLYKQQLQHAWYWTSMGTSRSRVQPPIEVRLDYLLFYFEFPFCRMNCIIECLTPKSRKKIGGCLEMFSLQNI